MNRSENIELIQNALQGRLTAEQKRHFDQLLAADAEFRADFEEERALEQLIEALPPVAVSSNFTARVLQAAQAESRPATSRRWSGWWWRPALATATLVLAMGGLFYHQQRQAAREELAQSLTQFTEVTTTLAAASAPEPQPVQPPPLPPVEMLQDFQAIQHLAHMPVEHEQDLELFAALQR